MSTEFTTEPKIKYDDFITKVKSAEVREPPRTTYILRHKVLYKNNNYIYVYETEEGNIEFERYGPNKAEVVLLPIQEEFNIKITDDCGIPLDDYENIYEE